ncbi:MAG: hypothetical protein BWY15_00818 [Firmicutes bacterium ADurb.Bin193]|nr:MAG: hypothetical protein BWY15_00818 [Firmicutes bacterium ADurb.Bin193]
MVRCKFKCTSKSVSSDGTASISMEPVYCGSKENEEFFKYTPCGSFHFGTINEEAAKRFEEGKEYYIDRTQRTQKNRPPVFSKRTVPLCSPKEPSP